MTIPSHKPSRATAFTLIELLVVIGIIAVLAAMIIPAVAVATRSARLKRATTELRQLETVISRYKAEKGFFPPDNTNDYALPQLFYELTGTYLVHSNTANKDAFIRVNGLESIWQSDVPLVYYVGGFMNTTRIYTTNLAEVKEAEVRNFWPGLEPAKLATYKTNDILVTVLGLPFDGPRNLTATNNQAAVSWNPWNYNSSNPTNNPDSYDLWIDLKVSSPTPFSNPKYKIYRISNWSAEPMVVQ